MNLLQNEPLGNSRRVVDVKYVFLFFVFFFLCGCSIWDSYLDPDYDTSRANRLCHPYGDCSQGTWVAVNGAAQRLSGGGGAVS